MIYGVFSDSPLRFAKAEASAQILLMASSLSMLSPAPFCQSLFHN